MTNEKMIESLPEVLNRLEGKGTGSRTKGKELEDLQAFASFLQFAADKAVESGELPEGFPGVARSTAEGPHLVGDDDAGFTRVRSLVNAGLEPGRLVKSRDIPREDAGKTNPVVDGLPVEELGQEARANDAAVVAGETPVTIPIPDNPQNAAEWLPLLLWGLPYLQKLISKIRKK